MGISHYGENSKERSYLHLQKIDKSSHRGLNQSKTSHRMGKFAISATADYDHVDYCHQE